jgi:hypothetical protein
LGVFGPSLFASTALSALAHAQVSELKEGNGRAVVGSDLSARVSRHRQQDRQHVRLLSHSCCVGLDYAVTERLAVTVLLNFTSLESCFLKCKRSLA